MTLGRSLSWGRKPRRSVETSAGQEKGLAKHHEDPTPEDLQKQATLVLRAAASKDANAAVLVSRLLSLGAPVNCRDTSGFTPLAHASRAGSASVVAALLERGADPQIASRENKNPPLFWAAGAAHLSVVRLLLRSRAVRSLLALSPELIPTYNAWPLPFAIGHAATQRYGRHRTDVGVPERSCGGDARPRSSVTGVGRPYQQSKDHTAHVRLCRRPHRAFQVCARETQLSV